MKLKSISTNGKEPPTTSGASPSAEPALRRTRLDRDENGVVTLIFDHPDRSANLFDRETFAELEEHFDYLETDPAITGLILRSAKPAVFIAGADLKALAEATSDEAETLLVRGQALFNRVAALRIPTVAAIHGACLGGGLELALACDWRVASTGPATRLGLPETQLGILPAWGGTTRLPRLIGLPKALKLILSGKPVDARRARKQGLIDATGHPEQLRTLAIVHLDKGKRPPSKPSFGDFAKNRIAARIANRDLLKKTRGLYPAPLRALDVAIRGLRGPVEHSLELEREAFLELFAGEKSQNLVRTFHLQERARRGRLGWKGDWEDRAIDRVAVIGAGVMGAGIAHWLSGEGKKVFLRDLDPARLAAGMERIDRLNAEGVRKRVLTEREARAARDRIVPLTPEVPLRGAELVIEAATENLEVKKAIFRDLAAGTGPETVLATNTSALPLSQLAEALEDDDAKRLVGLHFFNPVHRMKLVEVVRGKQTSDETVFRAVQFVRRIGKLPVVVEDTPGFLVNRILMPYLIEAGRLVEEGVDVWDIDEAMLDFGMPMGPLRLLDEIGLDVARDVGSTMEAAFGDRMTHPGILDRLIARDQLGRKSGAGFYLYPKTKSKKGNPVVNPRCRDFEPVFMSRNLIARRLSLLMVNEAFRCLEENVVDDLRDIDFAMIFGTGFAPFRGGPIQHAESLGLDEVASDLRKLGKKFGVRYEPCARLAADLPAETVTEPGSPAEPKPESEPDAALDDPAPSVIDTSKMSPEERAALELAESARTQAGSKNSLGGSFFMGSPELGLISRFPAQDPGDRARGDVFLEKLTAFLQENVNADAIDRDGEIPPGVREGLAELGAFGIKIPEIYGGLGLSQTNYSRAAMTLGGVCGNLTALLSAHQSIGVPQPLLMFGTPEQKEKFLPRLAAGEVSAFALTEPDVGSDPARMTTIARPVDGGDFYEITGTKLWCTNGTIAGLLVVMAKIVDSPEEAADPGSARTITAFVVEADAPGVKVTHRCRFMGLRALYNGVMEFDAVRVPKENIILAPGKGLKVALSTLNTGRLTLPAACVGMARECLDFTSRWTRDRVQWGAPIFKHDAIAQKLARMAADTLAIEAMVRYTSALVDHDKKSDIRLEAAFAKMWGTERAWEIADQTMQIRGGRGYETADSLRERGEEPMPVERFLRDSRINTIFEGSSEIMRLFIAREALDPHLRRGGPVLNSTLPLKSRAEAALKSAFFYGFWYPGLWLPRLGGLPRHWHPRLRRELRKVRGLSRGLARRLFHAMLRHGPKLEKKQVLLGRFVEAGAELFAMTTTLSYAQHLLDTGERDREEVLGLATYFCERSRVQVEAIFAETSRARRGNRLGYTLARKLISR